MIKKPLPKIEARGVVVAARSELDGLLMASRGGLQHEVWMMFKKILPMLPNNKRTVAWISFSGIATFERVG